MRLSMCQDRSTHHGGRHGLCGGEAVLIPIPAPKRLTMKFNTIAFVIAFLIGVAIHRLIKYCLGM